MQVIALSHPLAGLLLTTLRVEATEPAEFRRAISALSSLLFIEASKNLTTSVIEVRTPLETTIGAYLERQVVLVPILRAALTMIEGIWQIVPDAIVQHIGVKRNEETLLPMPYYSNIDKRITNANVFILDPMLATGGTLGYAIEVVSKLKPASIQILSVISAPEGIEKLSQTEETIGFPISLYTACIDRELDDKGYILPGLGDAGDRAFGT